ncbi:MAG: NAD-dependent dihydropyrimidine dehydrogenase subunit PreA [Bacteroidales bacterium]|nr:NAD-dependent dihydropyrimidine dehydrogenase subunit PreA [Bacteroidales bacterium]
MNDILFLQEEASRCLLCADAPCSRACRQGDPARAVRAIRFGNVSTAGRWLSACTAEDLAAAENACIHYDRPVRLRDIARALPAPAPVPAAAPSLAIDFCGIPCENPFFLASSAVCTNYEMVSAAFEAGWAGVFYKTICLQEIREVSPRFDAVHDEKRGIAGFRNMEQLSENKPETDFDILHRLKQNYPSKIVVASIMGSSDQEWIDLAKRAEAAGVDAIELNFSCPQMRLAGMGSDVGQNVELVTFYTAFVKRAVSIPVIPKMTPNLASMTQVAMAAYFAGADGISAINTIKSVTMGGEVSGKRAVSGYSGRAVKPIALRFILQMAKNPVMKDLQLSGIGGIETWRDALDFLQLGCRNVQVCTAVMQFGYRIIDDLVLGLQSWMLENGVSQLSEVVGCRLDEFVRPADLDRDTKVFPVIDREVCIGCGRCYISCRDGGHQAISFGEDRQPHILGAKCVGCHLCRLVCPTGAIGVAKRIPKQKA